MSWTERIRGHSVDQSQMEKANETNPMGYGETTNDEPMLALCIQFWIIVYFKRSVFGFSFFFSSVVFIIIMYLLNALLLPLSSLSSMPFIEPKRKLILKSKMIVNCSRCCCCCCCRRWWWSWWPLSHFQFAMRMCGAFSLNRINYPFLCKPQLNLQVSKLLKCS